MNIVFLDRYSVADASTEVFRQLGHYTEYEFTTPQEIVERAAEAEVIITNKVVIDGATMEQLPRLRLICVAATGLNNIDLMRAEHRGILVRNVAGYSTQSVVQTTLSLLLGAMQQLNYYDSYVKEGSWSRQARAFHHGRPFREIAGMRWGIIGMGSIGQQMATVAEALGAEVAYYSTSGRNVAQPYLHLSLASLLTSSDILTIHAPLNQHTEMLLGEAEFALMKPTAYLVNVGRGGIVDEAALIAALDEDRLAGAGLDVFKEEPIRSNHPLYAMKQPWKLVATPHLAWASAEARQRLIELIVANIEMGF